MVANKIKQLINYESKAAALRRSIEKQRTRELASLHEKYGYDSVKALIKAIRAAAGSGGKRRGRKAGRRRKRARITPNMRQKIKAAIQAGKTGAQVAESFGISLPSVHNIKKAFGLVKSRKK